MCEFFIWLVSGVVIGFTIFLTTKFVVSSPPPLLIGRYWYKNDLTHFLLGCFVIWSGLLAIRMFSLFWMFGWTI